MTPYPHPSTQHQKAFNEALRKTRVKIKQSFGIIKRKFHLMHSEIRMDPVQFYIILQSFEMICTIQEKPCLKMTNQMCPHMMVLKMDCKLEITFVNITSECFTILLLCCTWYEVLWNSFIVYVKVTCIMFTYLYRQPSEKIQKWKKARINC